VFTTANHFGKRTGISLRYPMMAWNFPLWTALSLLVAAAGATQDKKALVDDKGKVVVSLAMARQKEDEPRFSAGIII